jgi:hypothetical protein
MLWGIVFLQFIYIYIYVNSFQKKLKLLKFYTSNTILSQFLFQIQQKNHGSEDSFPIYESNLVEEIFAFWIRLIAFFS